MLLTYVAGEQPHDVHSADRVHIGWPVFQLCRSRATSKIGPTGLISITSGEACTASRSIAAKPLSAEPRTGHNRYHPDIEPVLEVAEVIYRWSALEGPTPASRTSGCPMSIICSSAGRNRASEVRLRDERGSPKDARFSPFAI